jgi:hypothetical protein
MTTDQVATLLVYIAAPAATLFPLAYAIAAPWWSSWTGRAVLVSKVGLALLVDASLAFRLHGSTDYPGRAQLVLVAFALIVVGTYMYFAALIQQQFLRHRQRGTS